MSSDARLRQLLVEPSTDAPRDERRLARVALSREEMLAQGPAIARTLQMNAEPCRVVASALASQALRRVVIVGCGDSWFAGVGARFAWERLTGIPTEPAQALDFAEYGVETADANTLVIGISASGSTEAVTSSLDRARARGARTVGISNAPGSPRMAEYDGALVVHATRRGWPTQSSTATIALLCALAAAVAMARNAASGAGRSFRDDLEALPELIGHAVAALDQPTRDIADAFHAARLLTFVGAGPHYAAAAIGAAKIREFGPIHTQSMPLEEFHHYRLQKPGDPMFLLAPDEGSRPRALDAAMVGAARGGRTIALVPEGERAISPQVERALFLPPVRPELAPILYCIPLHLFAYHFTMARADRGLGYPGAFE